MTRGGSPAPLLARLIRRTFFPQIIGIARGSDCICMYSGGLKLQSQEPIYGLPPFDRVVAFAN